MSRENLCNVFVALLNIYLNVHVQDAELSPDELLIKHLEKQISENKNNIEDLKILWMREQSHIVTFKQQRSNQLHQLNIYRKRKLVALLVYLFYICTG